MTRPRSRDQVRFAERDHVVCSTVATSGQPALTHRSVGPAMAAAPHDLPFAPTVTAREAGEDRFFLAMEWEPALAVWRREDRILEDTQPARARRQGNQIAGPWRPRWLQPQTTMHLRPGQIRSA